MKHSYCRFLTILFLAAGTWSVVGPQAWARDDAVSITRAERTALWAKNVEMIERTRRAPIPETLEATPAGRRPEDKIGQWSAVYRKKLADNEAAILKDYNWYVEQARGHLSKGEIREALIRANNALNNARDSEALLASDWIGELAGLALTKAKAYREAAKWREAHSIYYDLTSLFEDNKEYEKGRRDCLNIARLNVLYADEKRWPDVLEGIDSANATDALDRIERHYVEEVEFRDIAEAGLEHLLLLGESESMRKTFEGLGDEELRGEFNERLQARLTQVRKSEPAHFRGKQAKQYFRRIIVINNGTVRLPEELIVYEFMAGALDPLDDFTSVIWPIEFLEFDKHTRGGFVGVGISITGGGDFPVTVVTPLEDTPAYRAGILPDDQITHVNGEPLKGISLNKVVQEITGPIGTEVTLTIHRPSENRDIDFTLKRAQVELMSVKGYARDQDDPAKWDFMIDSESEVAYARVNSFQENTVEQLYEAIRGAVDDGARGLILDLRFNPGGLMKAAIEMAQLFLKADDLVVSTRGLRDPEWHNPKAAKDGPFVDLPLVVLVNEASASASEIVSGALQDHQRAVIVGDRTFGKFSVQKLMQLSGTLAHLKLTTARYYLPSGDSFHHDEGATEWGVMPDSRYETVPKEMIQIRRMWRAVDVLGRAPGAVDSPEDDATTQSADDDAAKRADHPPEGADAVAKTTDQAVAGTDEPAEDQPKDQAEGDAESTDDAEAVADASGDDDEEEDKLNLEPDLNEMPDVDLQLDTALLLMRLHLMGERELLVAAGGAKPDSNGLRNP